MSARLCSAAALPRCEDLSPRAEVAEGRAPRYNGGMETTAGLAYAVNVTEAPVTVKAKKTDDSTETIKVLESVGQHTFIAMSGETVFDGGAVGLVQGPFDPARALGGDNGGAGNLSPEAKAFLEYVTDGKLTFDAAGRLQIATSVDATGTFNHDGYASNYVKTVAGARYTTTVNANEVLVKKSSAGVETVLMHLHDGVLELGGERVLTEGDVFSRAQVRLSSIGGTYGSPVWTQGPSAYAEMTQQSLDGEFFVANLYSTTASNYTDLSYFLRGVTAKTVLVTASTRTFSMRFEQGVERIIIIDKSAAASGSGAEIFSIGGNILPTGVKYARFVATSAAATDNGVFIFAGSLPSQYQLPADLQLEVSLPTVAKLKSGSEMYPANKIIARYRGFISGAKIYLPKINSSLFVLPDARMDKTSFIWMLDHINKSAEGLPTLTVGLDSSLGHQEGGVVVWDDVDVAAAVDAVSSVWDIVPNFNS